MFKDKTGRQLSAQESYSKIINRFYNILLDFELMLLRIVSHLPSHTIRRAFYLLSGMKIGKGSTIHMWARFYYPKNITIGADTIIGDHAFLDGRAPLIIGNHVNIASQVLIYNSEHDIDADDFHATEESVFIEDYVYIGSRVTILPGVKIGKGAVVAAGAVITKNVPELTVVGGIPAREIRKRNIKNLNYTLGRARLFQ